MDNLFVIIFYVSMLALSFFVIRTSIFAIAKDKEKRKIHLKRSGISLAVLIVSIVGFGFTTPSTVSELPENEESEKLEVAAVDKPESMIELTEEEKAVIDKWKEEKKSEADTGTKTTAIKIDTSVFEYAKDIKLTDAIDINNHVTLMVDMSEDLTPGLATQHVVNQTYDFVQQDDVKSAKTITVIVRQTDKKIAQYTINADKFKPNDDEPMADAVISASEIDSMTDEVKEFGKTMGTW